MGGTGPYSTFAGYGNVGAAMSGFQNIIAGQIVLHGAFWTVHGLRWATLRAW